MSELLENVKRALVNRYLIEREVGSGGMAVVYLAEDVKHRRKVAIKALKPELAASIGADRFLREIEIAAGLNHPHILPLYDSGEAGGLLFYVMPYVEGESLRDRLRRERQLPLEDALQIAREVADGLSYAHSLGIIHRDIKPENVLLSGGHAVIADFGIARAIAAAGGEHLTETGMSLGTPTYMSPEQAAGAGRLDGRSDLYSLGCMVYEMLAGQPPFGGPTVESILHQHLTLDAPSVGAVRPSVPVQVATAVQRAMAKTPADRFATASEFGGELGFAAARVRLSGSVPMEGLAEPAATAGIRDARLRRLLGYAAIGTVAVGVGIAVASLIQGRGGADGKRLTVLPFENLGLADDEYFAAGITDEITSRLAGVGGLSVMARQSALQYKGTNKTPQQIGSELNVDYLLTGTISWQKGDTGPSRVRVRPQLIQAADASQLWADVYDEDMTEVFTVQANIAEQVVSALGLALVEPEREAIDARPTENLEAYDFYLQGNDFLDRPAGAENYGAAERMYERALELDTSFALAAARLSVVHSRIYWYYFDRSPARSALARAALERAVALAPDLPDVHRAQGEYLYRCLLDYDNALKELRLAGDGRPGDSGILADMGFIERRRGNFAEAARMIAGAADLEPRSASLAVQAGITYLITGQYDLAEQHLYRARAFAPDELRPHVWLAFLSITSRGDTAAARTQLEEAERVNPRQLDAQVWWHWSLYRILHGVSTELVERLRDLQVDSTFRHLAAGDLYRLLDRFDEARAHYDSARMILEPRIAAVPDEPRYLSELAIAYAGLGMRDEALDNGERAVALGMTRDRVAGPQWIRDLAHVYTMVGSEHAALDALERYLNEPSWASSHWLRLDPLWRSLHSSPRFQRLLARSN